MTYPNTNRSTHKTAVTVTATVTDLLTAAEQSLLGARSVFVFPDAPIWVGSSGLSAANGARQCPAGITTEIVQTVGPLKAVVVSGSTASVRVEIGQV